MRSASGVPSEDLPGFVSYYWLVRWDLRGRPAYDQHVLTEPRQHLVFEADRETGETMSRMVGLTRGRFTRRIDGHREIIGVAFHPGSVRPNRVSLTWTISPRSSRSSASNPRNGPAISFMTPLREPPGTARVECRRGRRAHVLTSEDRDTLLDWLFSRRGTSEDNELGQELLAEHYPDLARDYNPWSEQAVASWELKGVLTRLERMVHRWVLAGFDEPQAVRAVYGRTREFWAGSAKAERPERGLPEELVRFVWLEILVASHRQLTRWPPQLNALRRLRRLDLHGNRLNEIPDAVGELRSLEELVIYRNPLVRLTPVLAALPRLRTLRLDVELLDVASRGVLRRWEEHQRQRRPWTAGHR